MKSRKANAGCLPARTSTCNFPAGTGSENERVLDCDTRQYAIASELYSTAVSPSRHVHPPASTSLVVAKQESTDVPFTQTLALRLRPEQGPQSLCPNR